MDLSRDPKLQWALRHREFFPIDVNAAPREALLRIPGLGYKNVERVLAIRRYHRLTLSDLAKLHVPMRRLTPFVITADFYTDAKRLDRENLAEQVTASRQLGLFTIPLEVQTGQL